jgi:hypothetical protein
MKSQARLRLRQTGKHHERRGRYEGLARHGLAYTLSRAFEMNCAPKHSTEPNQLPYRTMDYVTGIVWHHSSHEYVLPHLDFKWHPVIVGPTKEYHERQCETS